jgi:hypothetical protein
VKNLSQIHWIARQKLKGALILAIQTNDRVRISKAKDIIIKLEKDIAIDDKPRLWVFAL